MPQTKKMNLKYKDDCLKCFVPQNQDEQIPEKPPSEHMYICSGYTLICSASLNRAEKTHSGPIQPPSSNELLSVMMMWKRTMCHIWKTTRFFLQIAYKFDWSQNTSVLDAAMAAEVLPFSVKPHPPWASSALERTRHYYRTFIFQNVSNQQSCSNNSSVPMRRQDSFASQHLHKTLLAALHTGERNKNHTNPTRTVLLTFIQFSFWIPKYFIFVSEDIIMDIELVWNRSL